MNPLTPYLNSLPDWKDFIKDKWILYDADSIIAILEYGAKDFFETIQDLNVTNCLIHPTKTELLRTNDKNKRAIRLSLFNEYEFQTLPLKEAHLEKASDIQLWLSGQKCFPSPWDLYLGGVLATFTHNNIVLLSGNLSDLPHPLFKRESYLVLQNANSSRLLTFLSLDHVELGTI